MVTPSRPGKANSNSDVFGESGEAESKTVTLSGGWNDTFTTAQDMSIISVDRELNSSGIAIGAAAVVTMSNFSFQYNDGDDGAGIRNLGRRRVTDCSIMDNQSFHSGGGVYNAGVLVLNDCAIAHNDVTYSGRFCGARQRFANSDWNADAARAAPRWFARWDPIAALAAYRLTIRFEALALAFIRKKRADSINRV